MKSKASESLPWPLLVGAKFLQVHPIGTIAAILLALPGQVALIASFLLPIKIIMLMASDGMPRFIPGIAANMDKKTLISVLAGLSIASFIFHHLTNKAIQAIAQSGLSRIEKRNQKLHLFEGQEELTRNSYTRYIDTVASVNFVLLGTAILFVIYPEVATTFLAYVAVCAAGILTTLKITTSDTDTFIHSIEKKLPTLTGIGFFLIFSWVLTDYIFFSIPESFIALLISIILGRQILSQINLIARSIFFFNRQKQKLKALLFHREVFRPTLKKENSIWAFLDSTTNSYQQLRESLASIFDSCWNDVELTWQDSGIPGIGFLKASVLESEKAFLVKVFEKKKTTEARHEAALLLDAPEILPCPKLIVDTVINGLHVHIMDISGYSFPPHTPSQSTRDGLALSISKVAAPSNLLSRYIRSHSMIWDQLEELQLQQLELVSKNTGEVQDFLLRFAQIRDELKSLPLRFYNSQLENTNLYILNPTGETQLLHWGKWSIEPLGVGLTQLSINKVTSELSKADNTRTISGCIPDPMTALLSRRLHKQIKKQLLFKALDTMRELSQRYH